MAFIKIDKKFKDWKWKRKPNMVAVWIHLLLEANYKDNIWQDMEIPRGSLVTSVKKISEATGLSIQQTRTCLSNLQSTNEITIKSTNKYTIITINKWEEYQTGGNNQQTKQQGKQTETNKQITNKLTTLIEYKEYKNKEYIEDDDINNINCRMLEIGTEPKIIDKALKIYANKDYPKTSGFYQRIINTLVDNSIYDKEAYISQIARNYLFD